jgi:hypothetical protein
LLFIRFIVCWERIPRIKPWIPWGFDVDKLSLHTVK